MTRGRRRRGGRRTCRPHRGPEEHGRPGTGNIAPQDTTEVSEASGGYGSFTRVPGGVAPAAGTAGEVTMQPVDMDGDGTPDLVLSAMQFLGNISVPAKTGLFAVVDITGDGAPDLILGRGSQPHTIAVVPAVPALTGSGVDFGGQTLGTAAPVRTAVVTNTGVAPALIAAVTVSQSAAYPALTVVGETCSGQVVPGGQCAVAVRFPTLDEGRRQAEAVWWGTPAASPCGCP